MSLRAAMPARLAAAFAVLAVLVPSARADDVPLPGPVIDGPVTKLGAESTGTGEPLWELGFGAAAVRFPDYRGSDQTRNDLVPLPFVAYRGRFLRADRDGARAILFAGRRVVVDVSLSASVPSKSKDNAARRGMPNLAGDRKSVV